MKRIIKKKPLQKSKSQKEKRRVHSEFSQKEQFKKYLERIEDPNYQGGSWALPANPTLLEKTKYELCQKVLTYYLDKELTAEETAQRMQLSKAETEDILHCRLDYFTLDRLTTHAGYLFAPSQPKVTVELKPTYKRPRKPTLIHA